MNHLPSDLEQRIEKINQLSLVRYLSLAGVEPTFKNAEFMVFDIPQDNGPNTSIVVNNRTNRFRLTMEICHGTVLDLAGLLFRGEPDEIVNDIATYHLDRLIAAENSNENATDEQPFKPIEDATANDHN